MRDCQSTKTSPSNSRSCYPKSRHIRPLRTHSSSKQAARHEAQRATQSKRCQSIFPFTAASAPAKSRMKYSPSSLQKRGKFPNAVACAASNLFTIPSFSRPNFPSFTYRFAIPGDVLPRRAVMIETEKLLPPLARPTAGEEGMLG